MKPFVKISVLVLIVFVVCSLFLENVTPNKNQNFIKAMQLTDTIIFTDEYIEAADEALHEILHIKQEYDTPIRFYTDKNLNYELEVESKNRNLFIGIDYNNFSLNLENLNDTVLNEITDSCYLQLIIQDTLLSNMQINCIEVMSKT